MLSNKAAIVVLFGAVLATALAQTNYCAAGICPKAGTHTACINKLLSWGAKCSSPNKDLSKVTDADKKIIVDYHNELRSKVAKGEEKRGLNGAQPSAANMMKLVWSDEIAAIAQTHAQQCTFEHDTCRNLPGLYVGQNIAMTGSSAAVKALNWKFAIDMWYNEVKDMNTALVAKFGSYPKVVGHYTQVVWAKTTKIGCGVSTYKGASGYTVFYVCNYGPGGNMLGSPIYQAGAAGSACPAGTKAQPDRLCA